MKIGGRIESDHMPIEILMKCKMGRSSIKQKREYISWGEEDIKEYEGKLKENLEEEVEVNTWTDLKTTVEKALVKKLRYDREGGNCRMVG